MNRSTMRTTAMLLVGTAVGFTALFAALQARFDYPDILREPPGYVLERFQAGGASLIALWYGMMIAAAMFIPIAWMVHSLSGEHPSPWRGVMTTAGVLAGIVQALGFARWVFLVPFLAERYADPASTEALRQTVAVIFAAFNQYAGVAVGEHLGFFFTALWTAMVAGLLLRRSPWLQRSGTILAVGIAAGLLEPFGVAAAGLINAVSYILWAGWLIAFGIGLLRGAALRPKEAR